jgi:amino acid adenylation domain-containing protein
LNIETWPTLFVGGTLYLLTDIETRLDPHNLLTWMGNSKISLAFLTTQLCEAILEEEYPSNLCLRYLYCGGDKLHRGPAKGAPFTLVNIYGPTENTINSTMCHVKAGLKTPPPIGSPVPNTQVYVLDRNLKPCPIGVFGELYLAGVQLARGYFCREDLTAERFVTNPFWKEKGEVSAPFASSPVMYKTGDLVRWLQNGEIEFFGRIDTQVKIRGFRIELGEVESALYTRSECREVCVIAREDIPGDKRLVAYIVASSSTPPSSNDLRSYLSEKLPPFMIPSAFVFLDAMPLTPNDKIDRRSLPVPSFGELSAVDFVSPRNAVEAQLLEIWKNVLKVDHISVVDSFFDLGGHSLLAARLMSCIRKQMNVSISISKLFQNNSISKLALILSNSTSVSLTDSSFEHRSNEEFFAHSSSLRGRSINPVVVGSLRSTSLSLKEKRIGGSRLRSKTENVLNRRNRTGSVGCIQSPSSVSHSVRDSYLTTFIQENKSHTLLRSVSASQTSEFGSLRTASLQQTPIASSGLRQQRSKQYHMKSKGSNETKAPLNINLPEDCYPMSYNQRSLWFLHKVDPLRVDYIVHHLSQISSTFDIDKLQRAFVSVAERHKSLITTYKELDGIPFQCDGKVVNPNFFTIVDSSCWTQEQLEKKILDQLHTPFDLQNGPVFRVHIYCSDAKHGGSGHNCLLITAHHIAIDGMSLDIVMRDVGRSYKQNNSLIQNHTSMYEFSCKQSQYLNSTEGERLWNCWRRALSGHTPTISLVTDYNRPPIQKTEGGIYNLSFKPHQVNALKVFAKHENLTVYTVLLTVFASMLHKYSGQHDILIGSPMLGRQLDGSVEVDECVGNFANPVVLRSIISPGTTFKKMLKQIFKRVMNALEWQAYPFSLLVERIANYRDTSRSPLFQVLFSLNQSFLGTDDNSENVSGSTGDKINLGGILLSPMNGVKQLVSPFDLQLIITESANNKMTASFQYATSLWKHSSIERMGQHFMNLMNLAIANPSSILDNMSILSPNEANMLCIQWNNTEVPFEDDMCIHSLFEAQVKSTPNALALTFENSFGLTYSELNSRANIFAWFLRSRGVRHQSLVGILMRRSIDMVVCMLAILKAGGAYIPVDPSYPKDRIEYMTVDSQMLLIVTQSVLLTSVPSECLDAAVVIDADWNKSGVIMQAFHYATECMVSKSTYVDVLYEKENIHCQNLPLIEHASSESLMYIIYTSGSTGKPKGVQIEHRSMVNVVRWHQRTYNITGEDRASQVIGPSFDPVGLEVWPFLLIGASLHIVDEPTRVNPPLLLSWINRQRITVCLLPTPVAELALRDGAAAAAVTDAANKSKSRGWPRRLRVLYTGGDKLHIPSALLDHQDPSSPCRVPFRFDNHYGPSEACIISTFFNVFSDACLNENNGRKMTDQREIAQRRSLPPIGRPIDNYKLFVMDKNQHLVPIGCIGELFIGGVGLSRGYLNRPQLTKERFIKTPDHLRDYFGKKNSEYIPSKLYRTGDLVRYLEDGMIEFMGRVDNQVKIRGLRIELGEIEAALAASDQVRDCIVVVREDKPGQKKIVAYVVLAKTKYKKEANIDQKKAQGVLRSLLKKSLPDYMVPTIWMFLSALPLTANGKVDRRSLPEPTAANESRLKDFVAPNSHSEIVISEIFCDILGLPQVGVSNICVIVCC